jgi:hypothetical protein
VAEAAAVAAVAAAVVDAVVATPGRPCSGSPKNNKSCHYSGTSEMRTDAELWRKLEQKESYGKVRHAETYHLRHFLADSMEEGPS